MASKTQTKTEIRNNTSKIGKLLRGIDNETLAIKQAQDKLNVRVKAVQDNARTVQTLIGGISNAALAAPSKPVPAKAVKPAKAAKPAKPAKVAKPAKPAKVAKPAKPAKVAKPVKVKAEKLVKAAKASDKTPPTSDRPSLKKVISEIIAKSGKPMGTADIYKAACQKYGYWSRQSLYNALKDIKVFAKNGEEYSVVGEPDVDTNSMSDSSDTEADDFVKRVEENSSVAGLV